MASKTPAGRLVEAFGDIDTMKQMYADDIVWTLSKSLGPIAGPYNGRDKVIAFNERVWGRFYYPEVKVTIIDEVGDDSVSAVRFIYSATMRRNDKPYELEYQLFAYSKEGKLTHVFESMDTLGSANLFADKAVDLNPYIG